MDGVHLCPNSTVSRDYSPRTRVLRSQTIDAWRPDLQPRRQICLYIIALGTYTTNYVCPIYSHQPQTCTPLVFFRKAIIPLSMNPYCLPTPCGAEIRNNARWHSFRTEFLPAFNGAQVLWSRHILCPTESTTRITGLPRLQGLWVIQRDRGAWPTGTWSL